MEHLPDALATLAHLAILTIAGNRLTELPCSMEQMSELTVLELSKNKISLIPQQLKLKPNLIIHNSF